MSVKKLQDIHGIGPSVEEKLIRVFGSEEAVLYALRESRIAELSSIEGIGERFALSLCRNLHYRETGEQLENFLKTEDARLIYNRVIDIIAKYGNTVYSRSKLYLFFPLPISAYEKILERQKVSKMALDLASSIINSQYSFKDFDKYLSALSPFKERVSELDTASRVIVTSDSQIFSELTNSEVGKHCEILMIQEMEEIQRIVTEYDEIILVGSSILFEEGYPNLITVHALSTQDKMIELVPEKTLQMFAKNRKVLISIAKIASLLKNISTSSFDKYLEQLDLDMLVSLGDEIVNLDESGEPTEDYNKDYSRLLNAEKNFETKLTEIQIELNEKLQQRLQDTTLELGGEKIIALLRGLSQEEQAYAVKGAGTADLREYLDDELYLAVEEIITEAETKLISELQLLPEEAEFLEGLFPRELQFPIDPIDDAVYRINNYLRQKRAIKAFELKVKLAKALKKYENIVRKALNIFFELDYLLMIGKFTLDYKLTLPKFVENQGTGLLIEDGRNLFLVQQELKGNFKTKPVSYAIGKVGTIPGVVNGERIILISGANSGGKTTLLVSLGIMVILAQMGLPIPCKKAIIGGFKEFHYYRKSSGQMDAGAFETTLKTLSRMIMSPKSRLVLADEMESISEPGASARVIAAFLDLLSKAPDSVGVFVTHLAQEITKYSKEGLRIDGIEAQGLSEDLELIVNRTPVYYKYAKSTPELIVRRLQQISKGEEREIYTYILEAFNSWNS
ncbi:MAG: MutS-related protein [Candidatus Hodarchaeales archaeon]